jgi:hypothetical protein
VGLKIVGNPPALDAEGAFGRHVRIDKVTLEHHCTMTRSGDGKRSRETRNAATSDDELHMRKLTGRGCEGQAVR